MLPILAIQGKEGRRLVPPCTDFAASASGVNVVWEEEEEKGGGEDSGEEGGGGEGGGGGGGPSSYHSSLALGLGYVEKECRGQGRGKATRRVVGCCC